MEFLTILLSGLLGLVSPVGSVIDRTAENAIRSRFEKAEQLQVRVDNAPSYQLLQGKVQRVRIAGRSLQLKRQDLSIAALELETDPIDLDPRSLGQRQPKLKRPFQVGVRLVLTQEHINQALQSPQLTEELRNLNISELSKLTDNSGQSYDFVNPRVELLENNRLRFQVNLQEHGKNVKLLVITMESGLGIVAGRQIQLIEPAISVNGEAVSNQFVSAIATNLSQELDLSNLEVYGLQTRLLKLKVRQDELEIAAFLRVEPSSRFLENSRLLI
jgi:hypothetical protein